MTTDQGDEGVAMSDLIRRFHDLHRPGSPLVLDNVWDVGSARLVAELGAPAVATGSWCVAAARGLDDGEAIDRDDVLHLAARLVAAVDVPVTIDIERGFGRSATEVGQTIRALASLGTAGANLEDGVDDGLRPVDDMVDRLGAAREAADDVAPGWFLNARYDRFLLTPPASHADWLGEAIERGRRYTGVGANGFFVPGLTDPTLVATVCAAIDGPVNVMVPDLDVDLDPFVDAGVARISRGPGLYLAATGVLRNVLSTRTR